MSLFKKLLHREPLAYKTIYAFVVMFVIAAALWAVLGLLVLVSWLSRNGEPGMFIFGILGIGLCFLIGWLIHSVIKYRKNNPND